MKGIILASSSPRRKALLKQLRLKFVVTSCLVEEKFNARFKPRGQAEVLSLQKAKCVAEKYWRMRDKKDAVIVGADTLIALGNEVLGKPKNKDEAVSMLKKLSGKSHSVITAFTLIDITTKKIITKSVETLVYFKKLSDIEIKQYIETEKIMDKAGSYAAQGIGASFIEKIEGDYFNIIGLPLFTLSREFKKFGIKIL